MMIESPEALQATLLAHVAETSRHVDIISNNFLPTIFSNEPLVAELTRLVRRGRQTRIRVLLQAFDSHALAGHRLIALARRLTSAIQVRCLPTHPEWPSHSWVIFDQNAGLDIIPTPPPRATKLTRADARHCSDTFDRLWLVGHEPIEMRRFG